MLYTKPTFTVPAAPTAKLACLDGVHHYAKGKCLRCDAPDPFADRPQHDLDERTHLGRS